mgnify:CR=1 FL=1
MRREPSRLRYYLIVFSPFAFTIVTDLPDVDVVMKLRYSVPVTVVVSTRHLLLYFLEFLFHHITTEAQSVELKQ